MLDEINEQISERIIQQKIVEVIYSAACTHPTSLHGLSPKLIALNFAITHHDSKPKIAAINQAHRRY